MYAFLRWAFKTNDCTLSRHVYLRKKAIRVLRNFTKTKRPYAFWADSTLLPFSCHLRSICVPSLFFFRSIRVLFAFYLCSNSITFAFHHVHLCSITFNRVPFAFLIFTSICILSAIHLSCSCAPLAFFLRFFIRASFIVPSLRFSFHLQFMCVLFASCFYSICVPTCVSICCSNLRFVY